ncbi:MAG TPA: hypothetical protein VFO70_06915, partial [Chitinophagaceae bacterium]|nr:hypothetical protein [Chitinophagaceae bacterium]
VYKIRDVYNFEKYDTRTSPGLNCWAWFQLLMILIFTSYLFGNIAHINKLDPYYIFMYGGFIFLSVYALTELMDRNPLAIFWECMRSAFGLTILFVQDDWFGASAYLTSIKWTLAVYFLFSMTLTGWFAIKHKHEDQAILMRGQEFSGQ